MKTLIEPEIHDLIASLVKKQLEVLAAASELSRQRVNMGELKKTRDGIIAEITRHEVSLGGVQLPFGLMTDADGYIIASSSNDEGEE